MQVEIDDAGTGSPVGGIVIGCRRGDKFSFRIIPPTEFHDKNVFSREVQIEVKEIIEELLNDVGFEKENDEILICSSRIFNEARKWFDEKGIKWKVGRIEGRTQDLVESVFDLHLVEIGVPRYLVKRLLDYKNYVTELLKWVALDLNTRSVYVKKSFKIWKNGWSKVKIEIEKGSTERWNRKYCIACGWDIKDNDETVIIKYITPKKVYTSIAHRKCIRGLLI